MFVAEQPKGFGVFGTDGLFALIDDAAEILDETVAGLEPGALDGEAAAMAVVLFAGIEKVAAAAKARCAAPMLWSNCVARSPRKGSPAGAGRGSW